MASDRAAWGSLRALRLAVFVVSASCLALASHVLAGGALPGLLPTVLTGALPAVAGVFLTRRRCGPMEILTVLGAVQVLMHEVFAASAATGAAMGAMPSMSSAGATGGARMATGGLAMLAGHTVATMVTALLLAWGEKVLHALVWLLRRLRHGVSRVPGPVVGRRVETPAQRPSAPPVVASLGLIAVAGVVRRGPPPGC